MLCRSLCVCVHVCVRVVNKGTTAVTTESASGSFEMINSLGQNEPDALTTPGVYTYFALIVPKLLFLF